MANFCMSSCGNRGTSLISGGLSPLISFALISSSNHTSPCLPLTFTELNLPSSYCEIICPEICRYAPMTAAINGSALSPAPWRSRLMANPEIARSCCPNRLYGISPLWLSALSRASSGPASVDILAISISSIDSLVSKLTSEACCKGFSARTLDPPWLFTI